MGWSSGASAQAASAAAGVSCSYEPLAASPPPHATQHQHDQRHAHQQQQHHHHQHHGVDMGLVFAARAWRLLRLARAAPAAALLGLSLLEALLVSHIGTISSRFYQLFVDGDAAGLPALLAASAAAYCGAALLFAAKEAARELLAWRWRGALGAALQRAYCGAPPPAAPGGEQGPDNPDQRLAADLPLLTAALADTLAGLAAVPFNVVWYTLLTRQVFGSWLPVAAAFGFFVAGALLQRLLMLPVARAVFAQEAAEGSYRYALVRFRTWAHEIALCRAARLERRELDDRFAAVLACQGRLVLWRAALSVATKLLEYGGLIVNFGCLAAAVFGGAWAEGAGGSAGGVAARVSVASFYLLTLINSLTQVLDLAASLSSLAGLTARVSQLLERLTDARQQGQPPLQQRQQQPLQLVGDGAAPSHKRFASQAVLLQPPTLLLLQAQHGAGAQQQQGAASRVMQVSVHSLGHDLLLQQVRQAFPASPRLAPLLAVVTFQFCGPTQQLMLRKLQQQQQGGCSQQQHQCSGSSGGGTAAAADEPACCSPCAGSSSGGSPWLCSGQEMQAMLDAFLHWQGCVAARLLAHGYWCDVADPRSGRALVGPPGSSYDEVIGASVLLGYEQTQHVQAQPQPQPQPQQQPGGGCPLVVHPDAGTQVYPATLFTSAPLALVRQAVQEAAAATGGEPGAAGAPVSSRSQLASAALSPPACPATAAAPQQHHQQQLLLSCSQLSVSTPGGRPIVRSMCLSLSAGGSLLIQGPSGAGKSTLVRCLAGLWPAGSGHVSIVAGGAPPPEAAWAVGSNSSSSSGGGRGGCHRQPTGVMFLPQRTLAAPGATLREQLLYPSPATGCACSSRLARHGDGSAWALAWQAWLSCGLSQQQQQQQQQMQQIDDKPVVTGVSPPCMQCRQLLAVLGDVGLAYLLADLPGRLDAKRDDWGALLSPGELQRLALARVLLHRPALAVLDEPTSSLPAGDAAALYHALQRAGISYVSVAHDAGLAALHGRVLTITGDGGGGWRLQ